VKSVPERRVQCIARTCTGRHDNCEAEYLPVQRKTARSVGHTPSAPAPRVPNTHHCEVYVALTLILTISVDNAADTRQSDVQMTVHRC
jgi:hypothetical protein